MLPLPPHSVCTKRVAKVRINGWFVVAVQYVMFCVFSGDARPVQLSLSPEIRVLHAESNTGQASPRTPTQRTFQPQEAVQP